jgi:hypothetical protein
MKGTTEVVQTYILPTNKLMTFNISSGTFKPYLQLEPYFENGSLGWRLSGHEISPQLLQPIARELFNALIRFAKSEGREDEEFDLVTIGLVAPTPVEDPQVEIDRQRYYQQAFLEDLKSHLDTRRDIRPGDPRDLREERSGPPPSEFNQPLPDHIRRELEVLKDSAASASNVAPATVPNGSFQAGNATWKTVAEEPAERLDPNISRQLQRMAEESTGGMPQAAPQNPFAQLPKMSQAQPGPMPGPGSQPLHPSQMPPQLAPQALPPQQQMQQPMQQSMQQSMQQPQTPQVPMPPRAPAPNMQPQPQGGQMQHQPHPPGPMPSPDQLAQAMAAAQNAANASRTAQPMNLPAALSLLIASLDREMEVVAKAGADAFALRDLGRADAALKFSSRLSEYRQMSQELLDYYRRKR